MKQYFIDAEFVEGKTAIEAWEMCPDSRSLACWLAYTNTTAENQRLILLLCSLWRKHGCDRLPEGNPRRGKYLALLSKCEDLAFDPNNLQKSKEALVIAQSLRPDNSLQLYVSMALPSIRHEEHGWPKEKVTAYRLLKLAIGLSRCHLGEFEYNHGLATEKRDVFILAIRKEFTCPT